MAYAILFHDDAGKADLRTRLRDAHIAHIRAHLHRIVASGGLLTDDGQTANGGLIVLDTDDRAEAEAFVRADPFWQSGVFSTYTITRWRKAFVAGQDFLPR